jgi:hypothetical protein
MLKVLKRLMGLWEQGSDGGFPDLGMGIILADFQAAGSIQTSEYG